MKQLLLGDFAKMLSLKIVLSCFLVSIARGKPNLSDEKEVCQDGHNDLIFRKCLERTIISMAHEIVSLGPLTDKTYKKALCKLPDEMKVCINNEGGFCQDQKQRGQPTIKFVEMICYDDKLFMDVWKLADSFTKPESVDKLVDTFVTCVKEELGTDATAVDELEKLFQPSEEKYANAAYSCSIVTALKLEPELVGSARRAFSAYFRICGFDVANALLDVVDDS